MKLLQALLLVGTGIAHAALFFFNADSPTRYAVGAFGLVYLGAGVWSLATAGLTPARIGAIACGAGLILGTAGALIFGFIPLGTLLLGVDAAVVALGWRLGAAEGLNRA